MSSKRIVGGDEGNVIECNRTHTLQARVEKIFKMGGLIDLVGGIIR